MEPLKLAALDAEDLDTISALLQDAVATVGEIDYQSRERRFAMVLNRFDWVGATAPKPQYRRRRAGLRVHCVHHVGISGFAQGDTARVLNLLSIHFLPKELPSGTILLVFSGDAAIRIDVECIEAALEDLGPEWAAAHAPHHTTGT